MGLVQRRRYFVDRQVQGALVYRVALYWLICLVSSATTLACWQMITGPARMSVANFAKLWLDDAPALAVSSLLLPFVLFDTVRLSNRFVGPVFRLRHKMRQLARGERVEPIKFRQGDFWMEFADEFNDVVSTMTESDKRPSERDKAAEFTATTDDACSVFASHGIA